MLTHGPGLSGADITLLRPGRRDPGQVEDALALRLGQRHRARARRGLGLARLAWPRAAAAPPVHDQAVHRVGHAVQGRPDRGQRAERLPLLVGVEEYLEHDPVLMLV